MKTLHSFLKNKIPEQADCCSIVFDEEESCYWLEHVGKEDVVKEKLDKAKRDWILSVMETAKQREVEYAATNPPAKMENEIARIAE